MQIAEEICRLGTTGGEAFKAKLTDFVREMGFTKIIETGTFHGTGTSLAIINGISKHPFNFITIEVNPQNYKIAQSKIGNIRGVHLINGLSVGRPELPVNISNDFPDHVIIDHQPLNRFDKYYREVNFKVPDHELDRALAAFDYNPEFVLLDSAGHMGMVEFKYLMARIKGDCYIALDDTDHIKHYHTMEHIKEYPENFEVVWSIRSEFIDREHGDKFGSAIVKYNHPK